MLEYSLWPPGSSLDRRKDIGFKGVPFILGPKIQNIHLHKFFLGVAVFVYGRIVYIQKIQSFYGKRVVFVLRRVILSTGKNHCIVAVSEFYASWPFNLCH